MPGLEGKVALITGAGGMRGVGRATALKLARQGVDLALTDVQRETSDLPPQEVSAGWRGLDSVAEEVSEMGRRCYTVFCDLGNGDQIEEMVDQVVAHYGRIDVLVNNARAIIGRDRVPVTDLDKEVWDHFLAINTTAVFLATKLVGAADGEAGDGRANHKHRFQRGKTGQRHGGRLFSVQVRCFGTDPSIRPRPGPVRYYGQRRMPRPNQHRPHELLGKGPSQGARNVPRGVPPPNS